MKYCTWDSVDEMLIAQEGLRTRAYKDSEGFWTIGVGHLLPLDISSEEASQLVWDTPHCIDVLHEDLYIVYGELDHFLFWWRNETKARQYALISMAFNLGITKLLKFKKMIEAWESGDYPRAAAEALDSRWARQVKTRATVIAKMIQYGE